MQPTIGYGLEDVREPPRHPCGLDPLVGRILRQVQLVDTVGEHRRVRRRQVELARVELGEVGEERGGGAAILGDQREQVMTQLGIAEVRERIDAHDASPYPGGGSASFIPRAPSALANPATRENSARREFEVGARSAGRWKAGLRALSRG